MNIQIEKAIQKFYPNPSFPMVIYEAVANAIDAKASEIQIAITSKDNKPQRVEICDNGLGLGSARYDRFKDLLETEDEYHKGLGRLVYLSYFDHVQILSVYNNEVTFYKRNFTFSRSFESSLGENSELVEDKGVRTGSRVIMTGFNGKKIKKLDYLLASYYHKNIQDLFLAELIDTPDLSIRIKSDIDGELLDQEISIELPDFQRKQFTLELGDEYDFGLRNEYEFSLRFAHQKHEGSGGICPIIVSDNRSYSLQKQFENIKVPDQNTFYYILESPYFTGRSTNELDAIVIPEQDLIYKELEYYMCNFIVEKFPHIKEERKKELQDIDNRYPHLIGYYEQEKYPAIINRKKLIEQAEKAFLDEQKRILEKNSIDRKDLETVDKLSSHTLALYILYRSFTIRKFDDLQNQSSADRCERVLHELLIPKSPENPSSGYQYRLFNNNTWVLDDRFMGFTHTLSDSQLNTLTKSLDMKDPSMYGKNRPDIVLIFSRNPGQIESGEKVQLVIVELKDLDVKVTEKMQGITQLRLNAKALMSCAEYKDKIDRVWYYLVTKIDEKFSSLLRGDNYFALFSSGSTPIYHKVYNEDEAPVNLYVLSLDSLIKDAESRNKIFLEILKGEFADSLSPNN